MSIQSEMDVDPKEKGVRVRRAGVVTLAVLAIVFVAGVFWYQNITSLPSVERQSEEVAALETHVLPLVKNLRATWYLNERFGSGSIYWKRGNFTRDPARARQDGDSLFDKETEESFQQFSQAIRASGVTTSRLREAKFADDGTLRCAHKDRRFGLVV